MQRRSSSSWHRTIFLAFALLASSVCVSAAQTTLKKVGEARLKVLVWSIYDSRLYTSTGQYSDSERPLRLEIEYLRNIKSDALADRTLQEWRAMGRDHPRQKDWIEDLRDVWRDVEVNDVLSLELGEDNIARFSQNGEYLGCIDDPEFGQHFVDIWLSADSTRPELRLALLGKDD